MWSKVTLVACMFGLVRAGALWNPSLETSGYSHGDYGDYDGGASSYGAGYGGHGSQNGYGNAHLGSNGAVSHVSITKEITPSVPYTTGFGHGHGGSQGYSGGYGLGFSGHGAGLETGLGHGSSQGYSGGYGLGYNGNGAGHGIGLGHGGYNHAISSTSQYSIHASPAHHGSYAPSSHLRIRGYGSYGYPSSYNSYGRKGW
ncbi:hypothetical protein ACJJTC_019734 [Scirpophaga incertulas]